MEIDIAGLPVWPDLLPNPLKQSYSVDEQVRASITDYVEGYSDQSINRTGRLQVVSQTWLFTEEEYLNIFKPFVDDELLKGKRRFLYKIKENTIDDEKEIIASFVVNNDSVYSKVKKHTEWYVTATLNYEYLNSTVTEYESDLITLKLSAERLCNIAKKLTGGCP